jgi:hypothetical protein
VVIDGAHMGSFSGARLHALAAHDHDGTFCLAPSDAPEKAPLPGSIVDQTVPAVFNRADYTRADGRKN